MSIHNQADKAAERLQKRLALSASGSGVHLSEDDLADLLMLLSERETIRDRMQFLVDMENEESRLMDALDHTKKELEKNAQEDQEAEVPRDAGGEPEGIPGD